MNVILFALFILPHVNCPHQTFNLNMLKKLMQINKKLYGKKGFFGKKKQETKQSTEQNQIVEHLKKDYKDLEINKLKSDLEITEKNVKSDLEKTYNDELNKKANKIAIAVNALSPPESKEIFEVAMGFKGPVQE